MSLFINYNRHPQYNSSRITITITKNFQFYHFNAHHPFDHCTPSALKNLIAHRPTSTSQLRNRRANSHVRKCRASIFDRRPIKAFSAQQLRKHLGLRIAGRRTPCGPVDVSIPRQTGSARVPAAEDRRDAPRRGARAAGREWKRTRSGQTIVAELPGRRGDRRGRGHPGTRADCAAAPGSLS